MARTMQIRKTNRTSPRLRETAAPVDACTQTAEQTLPLYKASSMLFQTKKGADVTFVLNSKEILAHKSFLIGRSTVFEAMFIGPMASSDPHPIITLNNYDATTAEFEAFLEYLYTDHIPINTKNIYSIFKLGWFTFLPLGYGTLSICFSSYV
jgi:hypothetical protein